MNLSRDQRTKFASARKAVSLNGQDCLARDSVVGRVSGKELRRDLKTFSIGRGRNFRHPLECRMPNAECRMPTAGADPVQFGLAGISELYPRRK